jgi:hypothetical protein
MRAVRYLSFGIIACLFLAPISFGTQDGKLIISTQDEIAQDIALAPCDSNKRLDAVKALFARMGASAEQVAVERLDDVDNIVIRKPGKSPETLVIGAHYDKTPNGCGAIDNWTGILTMAHIYRSLKDVPLQKTLIFIAFGKEENGLLGSKAWVRNIKKEEVEQYCAMVNIDSLGMAAPQVLENLSSKTLVNRVADLAKRMNLAFTKINIHGAGADSESFIAKKIPALTISAVANGWESVLHTSNDKAAKVNPASVYLGYRLALALIVDLNGPPCGVSRNEAK